MSHCLVSIIIPNFNRASLIGETLDSIIGQTYKNWECIIVDDGSSDSSIKVIEEYCQRDSRIRFTQRPDSYPKGANACRNIGKRKAQGEYVIFFDSDDLMKPEHVEEKVKAIESGNYDFVVARSIYFNNPENKNPINYRELGKLPISAEHFITKKINWLTLDPIYKIHIIKNIDFTEDNTSAEEYNFFCKLVLTTEKAIAIDKILSERRYHEDSYQFHLNAPQKILENSFYYYYDTYFEIKPLQPSKKSKKYILDQVLTTLYHNPKNELNYDKLKLYTEVTKVYGLFGGLKRIYTLTMK